MKLLRIHSESTQIYLESEQIWADSEQFWSDLLGDRKVLETTDCFYLHVKVIWVLFLLRLNAERSLNAITCLFPTLFMCMCQSHPFSTLTTFKCQLLLPTFFFLCVKLILFLLWLPLKMSHSLKASFFTFCTCGNFLYFISWLVKSNHQKIYWPELVTSSKSMKKLSKVV